MHYHSLKGIKLIIILMYSGVLFSLLRAIIHKNKNSILILKSLVASRQIFIFSLAFDLLLLNYPK